MTDPIILQCDDEHDVPIEACFSPKEGMALTGLRYGTIEVLDPSTRPLFSKTALGLGTVIGPHFGERHPGVLPELTHPNEWPCLEALRERGAYDPFPYGIARYVPWDASQEEQSIAAVLDGESEVHNQKLQSLECQKFKMFYKANLTRGGLSLGLNVVSDADSIVGFSFAFHLPEDAGELISDVANYHLLGTEKLPLPTDCRYDANHRIRLELNKPLDYTFHPYTNPTSALIHLNTSAYKLRLGYTCTSQENAWQVLRPQGGSHVILRCVSAKYPTRPTLTVSGIQAQLHFA